MNGLDLIDTESSQSNYWVVQPNTASPNADGHRDRDEPVSQLLRVPSFCSSTIRACNLLPGTAAGRAPHRVAAAGRLEPAAVPAVRSQPGSRSAGQSVGNGRLHGCPGERDGAQADVEPPEMSTILRPRFRVSSAAIFNRAANRAAYTTGGPILSVRRCRESTSKYQYRAFAAALPRLHTQSVTSQRRSTLLPTGPLPRRRERDVPPERRGRHAPAPLWQGNSFGQDNDAADNDSDHLGDPDSAASAVSAALRSGFQLARRAVQYSALWSDASAAVGSEYAPTRSVPRSCLAFGHGCRQRAG